MFMLKWFQLMEKICGKIMDVYNFEIQTLFFLIKSSLVNRCQHLPIVFFSSLKYLYFVDVMYLPEPKTVRNYRRFFKCVSHPQKMATSDFGCVG